MKILIKDQQFYGEVQSVHCRCTISAQLQVKSVQSSQVLSDVHKHTPTSSAGVSLRLEFPVGKGSLLELGDEALEVCFCSFSHLIAIPSWTVGV